MLCCVVRRLYFCGQKHVYRFVGGSEHTLYNCEMIIYILLSSAHCYTKATQLLNKTIQNALPNISIGLYKAHQDHFYHRNKIDPALVVKLLSWCQKGVIIPSQGYSWVFRKEKKRGSVKCGCKLGDREGKVGHLGQFTFQCTVHTVFYVGSLINVLILSKINQLYPTNV